MILVSVGTQFPFDRLIGTVDEWAVANGRTDVRAQTGPSSHAPRALRSFAMLSPDEFARLQAEAEVVVAHAGMGSILGALQSGTPIIIMPRDFSRGEHRNDHQSATARRFADTPGVYVAWDESELRGYLDRLAELRGAGRLDGKAPTAFTDKLRAFVEADAPRRGWRALLARKRR